MKKLFPFQLRILAWLSRPAVPAEPVHVAIVDNGRGGLGLFPANDAARDLFRHRSDRPGVSLCAGNFGTEADARRRAVLNRWDVVHPDAIIRNGLNQPTAVIFTRKEALAS